MIMDGPATVLRHFVHEVLPLKLQNRCRRGSQNTCHHKMFIQQTSMQNTKINQCPALFVCNHLLLFNYGKSQIGNKATHLELP